MDVCSRKTWPRPGRKGVEGLETGDGFLTLSPQALSTGYFVKLDKAN
jgi:hypothetical protein